MDREDTLSALRALYEHGSGPTTPAVFNKNAPKDGDHYMKSHIYTGSGENVSLHSFSTHDNMLVKRNQGKLSGQTCGKGQVSNLDKVMGPHTKTKQALKEKKDEILDLARNYMEVPRF